MRSQKDLLTLGDLQLRGANRMIIGIGSDLVDMRRIDKAIQTHGQKFLSRIFTEQEQHRANQRSRSAHTYAKMFGAKEAVAKALGTGFGYGVSWLDIQICRRPDHPPSVELFRKAKEIFEGKIPSGSRGEIHLTITDEPPYAQAFVVISLIKI